MSGTFAIKGATIFDGEGWREDSALLVRDGSVDSIASAAALPAGMAVVEAGGGMLAPGFVDVQVNGGGGVMFNDEPSLDAIVAICRAHAPFGTTALLPTLITDTPEITAAAVAAGAEAALQKIPGFQVLPIGVTEAAMLYDSLAFSRSLSSFMNSPMSRKCRYTEANRT